MKTTTLASKNYDYFICATRHMVKHGGKNGGKLLQKDFAAAIECSPEHLSGILSAKQSRKASPGLQEKIAAYFDMSLNDYVEMGRTLYEGGASQQESRANSPGSLVASELYSIETDIVTQVSRIVEKLHESENEIQRLNSIVEAIGTSVTIIGNDGKVIFQNSKSRELFGQNIVGKNYKEAIETTNIKFVDGEKSAVERCLESGVVENSIWWSGNKCISSTASVLYENSGNFVGIICTAKDITLRQKLMEDNKALISRLEEAINLLERGVLIYDQNRNIIFANANYRKQTGMTGEEKTVDDILKIQDRKHVINLDEIRSALFKAYLEQTEISVVWHFESGEKNFHSTKPIYNHDGTFVGMLSVISPFK